MALYDRVRTRRGIPQQGTPISGVDAINSINQLTDTMGQRKVEPGPLGRRASMRQRLSERNVGAMRGRIGHDPFPGMSGDDIAGTAVLSRAPLDAAAQLQGRLTAGGGRYPVSPLGTATPGAADISPIGTADPNNLPGVQRASLPLAQRILRGEATTQEAAGVDMAAQHGNYVPGSRLPSGTLVRQGSQSPTGIALVGPLRAAIDRAEVTGTSQDIADAEGALKQRYQSQIQRAIARRLADRGVNVTGDETISQLQGMSLANRAQRAQSMEANRDAFFGRPRTLGERVAGTSVASDTETPEQIPLSQRVTQPPTQQQVALVGALGLDEDFTPAELGRAINDRLEAAGDLTEADLRQLRQLALQQQALDPEGFAFTSSPTDQLPIGQRLVKAILENDKDLLKRVIEQQKGFAAQRERALPGGPQGEAARPGGWPL